MTLLDALLKIGGVTVALNEVRGVILTAPVFYTLWQTGGTWMAIYLALCSLGGIALSVLVPYVMLRKLQGVRNRMAGRAEPVS